MALVELPKPAETGTLRILMIQRGLTDAALAETLGKSRQTFANEFSKNFTSRRLRLLIEFFFGHAIWSRPEEFASRMELARRCGFDPFTAPILKLRQFAGTLKIRGRSRHLHKAALIALLQAHFASQSPENEKAQ